MRRAIVIDCNHPTLIFKIRMHFCAATLHRKGEQFVTCMEVEKGKETIINSATAN